MARELLQELEQERQKYTGIVQEQQILDGSAMDRAFEKDGLLDHVVEDMKRQVWFKALTLGWLPLEQPQVEKREESMFGRDGLRIIVSMRCDKKEG